MNKLKTILIPLILLCASLAHGQTRLDNIRLNLPSEYDWTKQLDSFKGDSTGRIQGWFVENEQGQKVLAAIIISMDKVEMSGTFRKLKEQTLQSKEKGKQTIFLDEGKTPEGYPYSLYKVLITKQREDQPGSFLMMYIETETSVHSLSARSIKSKLSDAFVDRWSAILKNPVITQASNTKIKRTVFILTTPKTAMLADSSITKKLINRFHARLDHVYKRNLRPEDVTFGEDRISITLRGNINEAKISRLLGANASVQFLPLYRGEVYKTVDRKADSLYSAFKAKYPRKIPPGFYIRHLPSALLKIPSEITKELIPKLKKMMEKLDLPPGVKLYNSPKRLSEAVLLYLVDTGNEVVNETNIAATKAVFGSAMNPVLRIRFGAEGRKKIAVWTQRHVAEFLAIVIDKKVYVAPQINTPIANGTIEITGDFTLAEMSNLRNAIQLSYPIRINVKEIYKVSKDAGGK